MKFPLSATTVAFFASRASGYLCLGGEDYCRPAVCCDSATDSCVNGECLPVKTVSVFALTGDIPPVATVYTATNTEYTETTTILDPETKQGTVTETTTETSTEVTTETTTVTGDDSRKFLRFMRFKRADPKDYPVVTVTETTDINDYCSETTDPEHCEVTASMDSTEYDIYTEHDATTITDMDTTTVTSTETTTSTSTATVTKGKGSSSEDDDNESSTTSQDSSAPTGSGGSDNSDTSGNSGNSNGSDSSDNSDGSSDSNSSDENLAAGRSNGQYGLSVAIAIIVAGWLCIEM